MKTNILADFQISISVHLKNGHRKNFINKCFKKFMGTMPVVEETALTVEKKPLVLVLLYLGSISLQVRTKLKKLKNILNRCNLQV